MLSLIKIEINKVSKSKLFLAWLVTIFIVLIITGIIIMGLATDNKLGEFVAQSNNDFRITGKWGGWAIVSFIVFIFYLQKQRFLIFEILILLSTIIIDELNEEQFFSCFLTQFQK